MDDREVFEILLPYLQKRRAHAFIKDAIRERARALLLESSANRQSSSFPVLPRRTDPEVRAMVADGGVCLGESSADVRQGSAVVRELAVSVEDRKRPELGKDQELERLSRLRNLM